MHVIIYCLIDFKLFKERRYRGNVNYHVNGMIDNNITILKKIEGVGNDDDIITR